MSTISLGPADPADPAVAALIAAHRAASREHYAPEDCHALDAEAMTEDDVALYAARQDETVLAIGGLKPMPDGAVELKSMFAAEAARGRGLAGKLLSYLLERARADGQRVVYLEAGRSDDYAAPARALYSRAGFTECPPFGDYVVRPASIFMRYEL